MSRRLFNENDQQYKRAPRHNRNLGQKRGPANEKIETYADIYFRENPNAVIDTDPPEVKMAKLEEKLSSNELEISEKFTILIQMKAMITILYGDESIESLKIHARLGRLYNENHRPQSALRHLQLSQEISKKINIDQQESISIAVETAEAHLALRNDNRQESQKHITKAMEVLSPFLNSPISDLELRYRRDLVNARVYTAGHKFELALEQYQHARETLESASQGEAGLQIAKLCVEISEVAEAMNDIAKTREYSEMAYETFMRLGMSGSASIVKPKVSQEKIAECEEKYGGQVDYEIMPESIKNFE